MKRRNRNINALSVTIIVLTVVAIMLSAFYVIYNYFDLFNGEIYHTEEHTVEFVIKNDTNINFDTDKRLYFHSSRETFGYIKNVVYNENNEMIVSVQVNGFFKDNTFFLNGKVKIEPGKEMIIMNNRIPIQIISVN